MVEERTDYYERPNVPCSLKAKRRCFGERVGRWADCWPARGLRLVRLIAFFACIFGVNSVFLTVLYRNSS